MKKDEVIKKENLKDYHEDINNFSLTKISTDKETKGKLNIYY